MRWALMGLLCVAGAQTGLAAQVVVTVTQVRDASGTVRVAVCPKQDFLKPVCPYVARAPAQAGSVVVTIDNVPPGVYAAQAYQDANDDGVLDRDWLGRPTEGMGFSRDAPFRFGPPAFGDAAFTVPADGVRVSLRLRYF